MDGLERTVANRAAAGASGHLKIGGRDFIVSPGTDRSMAAVGAECEKIANRLRQHRLKELMVELGSYDLAKQWLAEQEPVVDAASADGLRRLMFTTDGCQYLAWVLLREAQPELTLADLRGLVTDDNATLVATELLWESGLAVVAPKLGWGDWLDRAINGTDDRGEFYRKLAGDHYPPWLVPATLPIAAYFGIYGAQSEPQSHAEAVEQANAIRRRKGLPLVGEGMPTPVLEEAPPHVAAAIEAVMAKLPPAQSREAVELMRRLRGELHG